MYSSILPGLYYGFLRKNNGFPPHSRAFIDSVSGQHVTRDITWAQSLLLARGLRAADSAGLLPLHKGSTVLIVCPNSTLYPVVTMALLAFVGHMQAPYIEKRVLLLARQLDLSAFIILQGAWVTLDDLLNVLPDTSSSSIPEDFNSSDAHQTAVIFFSSGASDRHFKAVDLTHHNVTGMLTQIDKAWPHYQPEHNVVLGVVPFFHGIPIVSLLRYNLALFLATINRFQVMQTGLLVPPIFNFLAKHPLVNDFRMALLQYIIIGAARISPAMIGLCTEHFALRGIMLKVSQAYGMSEISGCVSFVPLECLKDGLAVPEDF
ncbi:uncharacterized protein PHACADRAFT_30879 [Phanerochaete carnosa HHB-10118-sp]|uniref:AMP-dependent synthetase/ligase domain-containing protein n=1 Tax=Phanerochaete carnosa (strain HHB-10118-sp) TaxID=650164 RepID=K5UR72_PHACS|nr:uncharacterized protein PHACADRAFT_30879 [Phanerochaete carnosa HHB-10118-sp]EKM52351.1 hypothetical protein PHACADRAFT_30879 [Phanerochaete carnosa HHB-10118-sp]